MADISWKGGESRNNAHKRKAWEQIENDLRKTHLPWAVPLLPVPIDGICLLSSATSTEVLSHDFTDELIHSRKLEPLGSNLLQTAHHV